MMKNKALLSVLNAVIITAIAISMLVLPVSAQVDDGQPYPSTPAEVGYIDYSYGLAVKPEPTAKVPQSKLWYNDGLWWGVLFDGATNQYKINRYDWANQSWVKTGPVLDNRVDDTLLVSTRYDALWDDGGNKLYLASHIKQANPSRVNNSDNWARLYRYSYNTTQNTYSLDTGFPVTINRDKTETLVLDKDSTGRLWVTYVSRIPTPIGTPQVYRVFVNYTTTAGDDLVWGVPVDLSTVSGNAAIVGIDDISTLVAYGNKVGLMWSNSLDGNFYFAEHTASSAPNTGWSPTAVAAPGYTLRANDHIHLVAKDNGQVFAAIKTENNALGEALVGVLAREASGSFSFHMFSEVNSFDTRPILVLNETENRLYMFVTSNEAGGVICVKPLNITTPLANMAFEPGNCSDSPAFRSMHFIASSVHNRVDNATTTKQAVTGTSGLLVLAADDTNGQVYLQNVMGNVPTIITGFTPANGATINIKPLTVTVTFNQAIDQATLTPANFKVEGPGGALAGTIGYNAATRTATFTSTGDPVAGATYTATVTTGVRDTAGNALTEGATWQFTMAEALVESVKIFLPHMRR